MSPDIAPSLEYNAPQSRTNAPSWQRKADVKSVFGNFI